MADDPRRVRFAGLPQPEPNAGPPASNPISRPRSDPQLAYIKQAATDRFSEWRRGNYDWNEGDRRAEIRAVVHPKPGGWDPWDLTDPAADGTLDRIRGNRRRFPNAGIGRADVDDEQQSQAADLQNTRFRPVGFRQVRRLGTGGNGLVWLFSMEDRRRSRYNIVVKVDGARGAEATKREIQILKVSAKMAPKFRAMSSYTKRQIVR